MDVTSAPGKPQETADGPHGRQGRHSGDRGDTREADVWGLQLLGAFTQGPRERPWTPGDKQRSPQVPLTPSCLQKRLPECSLKVTGAFVHFYI